MKSDLIKKAQLSDKTIEDRELLGFISQCFRETGGIRQVTEELGKIGFSEFNVTAYALLDKAEATGTLDLTKFDSKTLRTVCNSIVATLEDCGDLETLMSIELDEARTFLNRI